MIDRIFRLLFGPPDCDDCGAYDPSPRGPIGSWWHADDCPRQHGQAPEGSDDE